MQKREMVEASRWRELWRDLRHEVIVTDVLMCRDVDVDGSTSEYFGCRGGCDRVSGSGMDNERNAHIVERARRLEPADRWREEKKTLHAALCPHGDWFPVSPPWLRASQAKCRPRANGVPCGNNRKLGIAVVLQRVVQGLDARLQLLSAHRARIKPFTRWGEHHVSGTRESVQDGRIATRVAARARAKKDNAARRCRRNNCHTVNGNRPRWTECLLRADQSPAAGSASGNKLRSRLEVAPWRWTGGSSETIV